MDYVIIFWLGFLSLLVLFLLAVNIVQRNKRMNQEIKILSLQKENDRLDKEVRKFEHLQAQKSANLKRRLAAKKEQENDS